VEPAPASDRALLASIEEEEKRQAVAAIEVQAKEMGEIIDAFNANSLPDKREALARLNELSETIRLQRGESNQYDELLAKSIKAIRTLTMEVRFGG
jgi:hypothetical protein